MTVWDPGYESDDHRFRALSYAQTDVFLLCFDVSQRSSFDRVETYWVPDLRQFQSRTPIILVALKTDMRDNKNDCVSFDEGMVMASKVGAHNYKEVSSKKHAITLVPELFREAEKTAVLFNPDRE